MTRRTQLLVGSIIALVVGMVSSPVLAGTGLCDLPPADDPLEPSDSPAQAAAIAYANLTCVGDGVCLPSAVVGLTFGSDLDEDWLTFIGDGDVIEVRADSFGPGILLDLVNGSGTGLLLEVFDDRMDLVQDATAFGGEDDVALLNFRTVAGLRYTIRLSQLRNHPDFNDDTCLPQDASYSARIYRPVGCCSTALYGVVRDARTGLPIVAAEVIADDDAATLTRKASGGIAKGSYQLNHFVGLSASFETVFSAPGYRSVTVIYDAGPDQGARCDVPMRAITEPAFVVAFDGFESVLGDCVLAP